MVDIDNMLSSMQNILKDWEENNYYDSQGGDIFIPVSELRIHVAALKAAEARMERNKLKCESYSQEVVDDCDEFEKQYAALRQGVKNGV